MASRIRVSAPRRGTSVSPDGIGQAGERPADGMQGSAKLTTPQPSVAVPMRPLRMPETAATVSRASLLGRMVGLPVVVEVPAGCLGVEDHRRVLARAVMTQLVRRLPVSRQPLGRLGVERGVRSALRASRVSPPVRNAAWTRRTWRSSRRARQP